MKSSVFALATLVVLCAPAVQAQPRAAVAGAEVEALVTVVSVDKAKRTVVFRGPRGNEVEMQVPPEAPNFDQVKKGSVFKMKYAEAVAVAVTKGGAPSKTEEEKVQVGKKGGNPGGTAIRTRTLSGVIESIDPTSRYVALRGPNKTVSLKVGDDVNLGALNVGDRISIAYTQALAIDMVPQPKAKPAAKKAEKKA